MKTQLEHWRVLDAVITYGGVSQAGVYLHRTQSAISYSLKQLEEQAGIALLHLVGRKLQLTPAGHQLVMVKYFRKEFKLLSLKFPYVSQGFGSSAPN